MTRALGFLRTRVGRRFLVGNLVSAFLPLVAITVLSIGYLRSALREEATSRVVRLSKSLTLSVLSSLTDARRELRGSRFIDERPGQVSSTFLWMVRRDALDGIPRAPDDPGAGRPLNEDQLARLGDDRVVMTHDSHDGDVALVMGRPLLPWTKTSRPIVWGRLNPSLLWASSDETIGGEQADYCAYDSDSGTPLHCTGGATAAIQALGGTEKAWDNRGPADAERGRFFVSTREVYLRHELGAPEWRMVVVQPSELALGGLHEFRRVALVVMVAMAILIFLVSHAQIRRTTEPLARLHDGTQRLQQGDFSTPVIVTSDDEYADVAASFNGMARTLDRQLLLMRNIGAVDRAALTVGDMREVIDEALARFGRAHADARRVTIAVASSVAGTFDVTTIDLRAPASRTSPLRFAPAHADELLANPHHFWLASEVQERSYFPAVAQPRPEDRILVLPLVHEARLLGLVALGYTAQAAADDVRIDEARRLADRVALALTHVQLVGQLNALSLGTLTAFARAIDANSAWTAGHSERVTRTAVDLGRELALTDAELRILELGGLLHDIGKIAVPASILDKPGALTDEERRIINQHPVVGFEILTPIPAFADALPVVRSHHERMDGSGYPDGLCGDAIPWLARVLAVADVFDALVSDRPYRAGLSLAKACSIITSGAGTQFDPRVVLAFQDAVRGGRITAGAVSLESSSLAAEVARVRGVHTTAA